MPYFLTLTFGTFYEFLVACCLILTAAYAPRLGRLILVAAQSIAVRIGTRDWIVLGLAAGMPVIIRLALLSIDPAPQPYVMEEFNHLLEADTYTLGRLANPIHPLAVMLQSYQEVEWPHYMSARPPLPAIFLYIGVAIFHSPFIGNLLAISATSAALSWMLLGWVPQRWAVIGSFLSISTFCLFGYWINSYWCPTTIVLGGALLMGIVPRIEQNPQFRWAAIFIIGLTLLAGTRPYENGVYAGVICCWLIVQSLQADRRPLLRETIVRFWVPVAVGGIAIIVAQMADNIATTGNYRLMPYQIWRASQDVVPTFLWQPIGGHPTFYQAGAAQFSRWNVSLVTAITHGGLFGAVQLFGRQAVTFRDLLGPMLFLPLLCWSPSWFSRRVKTGLFVASCWFLFLLLFIAWGWAAAIIKAVVVIALLARWQNVPERLPILLILIGFLATSLPSFYMTVYFTAFTSPLLILVVNGMRYLSRWARPLGPSLVGFILFGSIIMATLQVAGLATGTPLEGPFQSHFDLRFPSPRREVTHVLAQVPGKHLIFVRTNPLVNTPFDPVWNSPDIDDQRIIWMRDLKPAWTAAAENYYPGRKFWLMVVDKKGQFTLAPYPSNLLPLPMSLTELPIPDQDAAERLGAKTSK